MRERTVEDIRREHEILRSDPRRYLEMYNERIRQNPDDASEYFSRHFAWKSLGRLDLALADLNKSIELEPEAVGYRVRGQLLFDLGEYAPAIDDFDRADMLDPECLSGSWGYLYRATCHARLGNEESALADCTRLKEDHWTPGLDGAPRGNKQEVIARIREIAAAAQQEYAMICDVSAPHEGSKMAKTDFDELLEQRRLLKNDPQKSLALHNAFIAKHPEHAWGYVGRHSVWERLGDPEKAFADICTAIDLDWHPLHFVTRGRFYRRLGIHELAIRDFDRAEAMAPADFPFIWGCYFRADSHARLGNVEAALADCARLPEDHRSPGLFGAPPGDKAEVTEQIRKIATANRERRKQNEDKAGSGENAGI